MDKSLKTKDLRKTAAERGKRDNNKTQPKTPDSLRRDVPQVDVLIEDADTLLRKPGSL